MDLFMCRRRLWTKDLVTLTEDISWCSVCQIRPLAKFSSQYRCGKQFNFPDAIL